MTERAIYPDLGGRVAVVTGASKGIGVAMVRALAANGADVAVSGRDRQAVDAVAAEARDFGVQAIGITAEVTDPGAVDRLRDEVVQHLGVPSFLFLFAGGFQAYSPLLDIEVDEWHRVIDANLTGTFLCLRSFVPGMIAAGGGSVITMSSNCGRQIDAPLTASYAASKAGIIQLTRHAAYEWAGQGVRVNCIAPATTETERVKQNLSAELREKILQRVPMGHLASPEDCANAALFLASEEAAGYLTGVTLDIAGGRTMM